MSINSLSASEIFCQDQRVPRGYMKQGETMLAAGVLTSETRAGQLVLAYRAFIRALALKLAPWPGLADDITRRKSFQPRQAAAP